MVNKSPDWWVKLADFGVSKRVRGENTAYHTSLIGDYVAPEIFDLIDDEDLEDNSTYTTAVDMWSLGCLSYWLLTTQTPFPGRKGLRLYCRGKMPFPSLLLRGQKLDDAGILFIERLMAVLPQKRLNASDARSDPWLESVMEPAVELRRRASVEDISDTGSMAQLRDRSSGSNGSSVRSNTLAEVAPNDGDEVKSAVTTPTASQDAEIIDTSTTDVDGLITSPGGVTLTMGNDPADRINYDVPSHSGGSGWSARSTENLDAPSLGNTALEEPTQEERHPMAAQLQSNALPVGQDNLADIDSLGAKVYEAKGSGNTDHKDEGKSSEETPELMQDVEVTDEAEEDLDSQTRDKSREDVAASVETVPGGGQPDNRTIDAPRMPRFSSATRTFDVDMPFLPLDLLERMDPVTPLASSTPDEDIMAEAGREADHQRSAQSWEDASKSSEVEEHVPLRYQLAFDTTGREYTQVRDEIQQDVQNDEPSEVEELIPLRYQIAAKTIPREHSQVRDEVQPDAQNEEDTQLLNAESKPGDSLLATTNTIDTSASLGNMDGYPSEPEKSVLGKFETRMAQSKAERKEQELKHDQAERPLGAASQNAPSEDKDLPSNSPSGKSWPYSHSSWQTEQDGERDLEEHYPYIPDEIGLSEGSRMHHTVPRKAVASTVSRKARVSEISGGPTAVERGSTGTDGPYGRQGNFEVVEERDLDGKPRPKLDFRNQHGLTGLMLDGIPRIVAAEQAKEQRPDAYRHAYSSLIPLDEAPRPVNGHQMGQRSEHREGSESPAASVSGLNSSPTSSAEAWLNDWLFSKDSSQTHKSTVEACVQKLSEAGFSREESLTALERHRHNIEQAVVYLFSKTQQTGTTEKDSASTLMPIAVHPSTFRESLPSPLTPNATQPGKVEKERFSPSTSKTGRSARSQEKLSSNLTTWIKRLGKKPGSVTSIGSPESSSPKPAKRGSYGAAKRNSYGSSVDNVVTQVRSEPDTAKIAVSANISTEPVNASPVIFSTASEEINALSWAFQTQWLPKCEQFIDSPPSDQKTRKSLYTQLAEALESQILNKSDNINVYDSQDVAEIVRLNDDVITILQELDDAASRWVALPFGPGG